jgi:hypothetical protein
MCTSAERNDDLRGEVHMVSRAYAQKLAYPLRAEPLEAHGSLFLVLSGNSPLGSGAPIWLSRSACPMALLIVNESRYEQETPL